MSLAVSVVIPTYNRAADVVRAVQSALEQTHAPLEVLVVDDGSTDATADVVRAMPAPVRYLAKHNGGVSSARNVGLREARGDVVALLDSDDAFAPTWLARAVEVLQSHPDCGAVCANMTLVDERGRVLAQSDLSNDVVDGEIPLPRLFMRRIGLGSNLCVRRSVLERVGLFDESMATGEDIDIALRLAAAAPLRWLPEALILITKTTNSLSGRVNTGNRLRVFDKFEQTHPELARTHAQALRRARAATSLSYALDLTVARRLGEARQRALESWQQQPSLAAAVQWAKTIALQLLGRGKA
jgi:glycosyltransferase involved in cell wall biosynthesis